MKKDNFNLLLEQFTKARGIQTIDTNSVEFMNEFKAWLKQNELNGNLYLKLLAELGFDYTDKKIVETSKGVQDSLIIPYNGLLITPFYENIKLPDERIIPAEFEMISQTPTFFTNDASTAICTCLHNAFMTQNPYDENYLNNWENIFNSSLLECAIGVYGNADDKDIDSKIQMILKLKEKIKVEHKEEFSAYGNAYALTLVKTKK